MKIRDIVYKLTHSRAWQRSLAWSAALFVKAVYAGNRWTFINREIIESYVNNGKPALFCFWHGRMIMLPKAWQWSKPFYMLNSNHADGRIIAQVIHHFGIQSIYGSTRRGGEQATRTILEMLSQGSYVGLTPDGPRGPGCEVSMGIIKIAALSGVDIIPMTYATRHKKILRTWDRLCIPLPFGRGCFVCGAPIKVEQSDDLEPYRLLLKGALDAITQEADRFVTKKLF